MIRETARWAVSSLILLFVVTVLTFVLVSLAPGDAAKTILNAQGTGYTPEQYQRMRHMLGLDQPLVVQYWHWLDNLLHGSLGTDMFSGQPVTEALGTRIEPSLSFIVGTLLLAGALGVGLGVASARRHGGLGRLVDAVSLLGMAVPNFWLALVLIELFAVKLPVFPTVGYTPLNTDIAAWLRGIVLPVITLSIGAVAVLAKQTRSAMSEVLAREFITMLRARGVPRRSIVFKHALRNAAIPVVTVLGLMLINLLSGTIFVEAVFAVPGLGQEAVTASQTHNLPLIEGVAFYFTIVVVITNLLVDQSYRLLDPKARRS